MKIRQSLHAVQFGIVCGLLTCFSIGADAQTDSQIAQYIQAYKSIAEEEMMRTGVPASISLAQGIVESQAGTGWLATHSNNQFGIKCKPNWIGPSILHTDDAPNECFRAYGTPDSSWKDHSDFLRSSPRYDFLFSLNPLDYKAWANGLKEAGYATDPTYASQLINTIEKWHLQKFSRLVYAKMKDKNMENAFAAMLNKKVNEDNLASGIIPHRSHAPVRNEKSKSSSPYPEGLFQINNLNVLYLPAGTQLISVAERYHIRLNKLVRFNDLHKDVLDEDMLIYLERKKKTGVPETYTAAAGETLPEIAQKEGIRLRWLLKRNRMRKNEPLTVGQVLYLKGYAPLHEDTNPNRYYAKGSAGNSNWKQKLSGFLSDQNKNLNGAERDTVQSATPQKAALTQNMPSKTTSLEYTVRQGDTLYNISKRYDTTVSQLKQWNHLEDNTIKIGQTLIIQSN